MKNRFVYEENKIVDKEGVFVVDTNSFDCPFSSITVGEFIVALNKVNNNSVGDTDKKLALIISMEVIPENFEVLNQIDDLDMEKSEFFRIFSHQDLNFDDLNNVSELNITGDWDEYTFYLNNGNVSVILRIYDSATEGTDVQEIMITIKDAETFKAEQIELEQLLEEKEDFIQYKLVPQFDKLRDEPELLELITKAINGDKESKELFIWLTL